MKKDILVLGGTGKTGSRVVERLVKLNLPVRIGSRSASPPFDWNNENTWTAAVDQVEKIYLTFQPDVAVPGAVDKIRSFVRTAKEADVRKIVMLSGRGEREAELCEREVISSGMDWTVVRANWFMQNFSEYIF